MYVNTCRAGMVRAEWTRPGPYSTDKQTSGPSADVPVYYLRSAGRCRHKIPAGAPGRVGVFRVGELAGIRSGAVQTHQMHNLGPSGYEEGKSPVGACDGLRTFAVGGPPV